MSTTLPSRTRSLRKASDASGGSSRYGRLPAAESAMGTDAPPILDKRPSAAPRSGQSPSRLPVKPQTRSTTSSSRPPSAGGISLASNASMPPPPPRANIGKPTTSANAGLQRSTSTRKPSDASNSTTTGGLQRSTSIRRPSESSGSTTTPGLQRSISTRRQSDASSTNTATSADPVKQDRSRPPLTQYKHLRTTSTSNPLSSSSISAPPPQRGHTRNKSSSSVLSQSARPPSRETTNSLKPVEHPQLSQAKKSGFSTYQQHFSPAKSLAPKPHPAAFLAPPSPSKLPSNIAISAETAKLQNELLQLHLLHKDAHVIQTQWKASARRKLEARWQDVVRKHSKLVQLETEESARINAVALKKWTETGVPGLGLAEKVQMLDEILTNLWNLNEPGGGKYSRLVRKFERWLEKAQAILGAREAGEGLQDDEVVFVEELEESWKEECLHLDRKLEMWEGLLRDLGVPQGESSVKDVLQKCNSLAQGMLDELSEMRRIEDEVIRRESDWIKGLNQRDSSDDEEGDGYVAGAIWRRM